MAEEKKISLKTDEALANERKILEASYAQVFQVVVNLDREDETAVCNCFFKYPTRGEYDALMKLYAMAVINGIEYWAKVCYIGGDPLEILLTNDYALRSLDHAMADVLYVRQSVLKKN